MGAPPRPPRPLKPPQAPDVTKAQINALAYAETERRLRRTSGRAGSFLTSRSVGGDTQSKPLLGM